MEIGGEVSECGPAFLHLDVDHVLFAVALFRKVLADDGGSTCPDCGGDVLVSVEHGPGNGHEAPEGFDLTAVRHDGFHGNVGGPDDLADAGSIEDVLQQLHESSSRMV